MSDHLLRRRIGHYPLSSVSSWDLPQRLYLHDFVSLRADVQHREHLGLGCVDRARLHRTCFQSIRLGSSQHASTESVERPGDCWKRYLEGAAG